MTTTIQGIGKPAGTSWPEMRVTASLYNSSDVFQSSITITPNLDGSWSQVLAAASSGSYQVIRETDSVGARSWKITVPASGTYKVVEVLFATPGSGITEIDADARYDLKGTAVANVVDYGATTAASGASNLTAFQAAINDANVKGLKVYIPGGTWNVNTGLLVGQRMTVEGAGRGRTILNVQSTGTFVASASAGTRLFDWNWSAMTISTTTATIGFDMDSVSTAHFRDLVISGFSSIGISIHSATSGGAVYNRFYDVTVQSTPTGWKVAADGSNAAMFTSCRANVCTTRGWDIQDSNDCALIGCQFEGCGVGVYLSGTVANANASHRIVNCRSENNTTGIQIASTNVSNTLIEGLWVDGSTTTPLNDGGTSTRYKDQLDRLVWLAEDHGIKGDGSTDNTTAINSLITTVNAAGGGLIRFSAGKTYLFGKTVATGGSGASIVLKTNVWIDGPGATLKFRDGIAVDVTTSYFPIWASSVNNVRITDINIIGNSANNTTALVCDMITLSGCDNAQVRNVNITDGVDSGIMYSDCTNSIIENVRIDTVRDLGLYLNDTANGATAHENIVRNCRINGAPNGGIALKRGANRFIVEGNTIYNCGNGITMEQGALAYFGHDSTISNNRLRHIGYIGTTEFYGIDLRGCDYVQCVNNRIDDVVNHAIVLSAARYTTVIGNVVNGTTGTLADGIRVQDYPTLISGYGTMHSIISNNIVQTVTGAGINFVSSSGSNKNQHLTVTHNQFLACTLNGMLSNANLDSAVVSGNIFQGTANDVSINASVTNVNFFGNRRISNSGVGTGTAPSMAQIQSGEDFRSGQGVIFGTSSSRLTAASTVPMYVNGAIVNGAGVVANWIGNTNPLTSGDARVVGFTNDPAQTHSAPVAYIRKDGAYEFANGVIYFTGTGSPEGVVTAPIGSLYTDKTGATVVTVFYVKTSGAGNTGWTAK